MAPSTTNPSTKVHPPSISSNTRSVSPAAPTNASQPPATPDDTFRYMQPGPTPVAGGDPGADFDRLSNNRNLTPIRPRVTLPDISALGPTPKKS
ncbi:hypothetical protein FSOLCH5_005877 [Fusarium solani]|uniref:uncharacterized protein n=1 Tax=Fusarium solani TaxID=169388 RepID=UPI00231D32D9|nr:hypothetical protein MRS44_006397 [Fusarium solani]KAJ4225350.1 hypothetical protein NW759_005049 [Fusarium solani]